MAKIKNANDVMAEIYYSMPDGIRVDDCNDQEEIFALAMCCMNYAAEIMDDNDEMVFVVTDLGERFCEQTGLVKV